MSDDFEDTVPRVVPVLNDFLPPTAFVGEFIMTRYRRRAAEAGYFQVARQLRKQGVPLYMALTILFGSP